MKGKVCIITLGCKVNKYESDCILRILEEDKYIVTEMLEWADYYIINTCAVTNEAEKKSRQYIAKINKTNQNAKIIICGCSAEKNKEQYLSKKNVVAVFDNQRKDLIVDYINKLEVVSSKLDCYNDKLVDPVTNQARAYIKIQDGCNRFCSYCIIPYVRGRSVSRDINSVVKEAEKLSQQYNEIVIVGIDMSDYKVDGKLALGLLMGRLSNIKARIRLGSLEVSVITTDFMNILVKMPNFAPQFHLSLQSGDDFILKKMNRKYTAKEFTNATNLIYQYFPNANITTDIIVGFPYEDDEMFENTIKLAKMVKFGKIHCFPFSAKKGTIAYTYPDISPEIKKARMDKLEGVASSLQDEYNKKFLNRDVSFLIEEKEGEYYTGYTDNYIKCYYKSTSQLSIGMIVKVKATRLFKDGLEVK